VTASEFAFLALGLVLGVAVGAALIEIVAGTVCEYKYGAAFYIRLGRDWQAFGLDFLVS